jgi:threonine dehydrogenase-like Zn-dependent dehydrogenase
MSAEATKTELAHLVLVAPRELEWQPLQDRGELGPGEADVRPLAVASCDLDPLLVSGAWPLSCPIPLGHEFVAEVVVVGEGVEAPVGQLVAVPFQLSCGACAFCLNGETANCQATAHRATYGFGEDGGGYGGAYADLVRVPFAEHMLVPLPAGVSPVAAASVGDNMADGFTAVTPGLEKWPDAEVLVVGGAGASIGLYAAGIAVALGAERVVYLDSEPDRLACAETLGAHPLEGPIPREAGRFQVTVDASGDAAGLDCAIRSTGPSGFCTTVAGMLHRRAELPVARMYEHCCTFRTGRVQARPAMPALLELIAAGRFRPQAVTSAVVAFEELPEALLEPQRKLVAARLGAHDASAAGAFLAEGDAHPCGS